MNRRGMLGGLAGGLLAGPIAACAQGAARSPGGGATATPVQATPGGGGGGGGAERLVIEVVDAQGRPKGGPVVVELLPDLAPRHVERIRTLANRGFYDGTPFHRVIEGFMAQGGDKTGTGMGGADQTGLPNLPAEFSPPSRARFIRGTAGMARGGDPDSANSQFFITFAPAPSLDGKYTIWGRVVSGMETVDQIKRGDPSQNGRVTQPDRIARARVTAG